VYEGKIAEVGNWVSYFCDDCLPQVRAELKAQVKERAKQQAASKVAHGDAHP
jgi:hypothetical protein